MRLLEYMGFVLFPSKYGFILVQGSSAMMYPEYGVMVFWNSDRLILATHGSVDHDNASGNTFRQMWSVNSLLILSYHQLYPKKLPHTWMAFHLYSWKYWRELNRHCKNTGGFKFGGSVRDHHTYASMKCWWIILIWQLQQPNCQI